MYDGSNKRGTGEPIYDMWHAPPRTWTAVWIYVGFIIVGAVIMAATHSPGWVALFFVIPAIVSIGYGFIVHHNAISTQEGVERQLYLESSGLAFLIVLASLLAWYFLEVFADMPQVSALWIFLYAVIVQTVMYVIAKRRMS